MGLFSIPLSKYALTEKIKKYQHIDSKQLKNELAVSTSIFEYLAKNDLKIFQQCLYGFDKYSVLQWKDKAGWSLLHDAVGLNYVEISEYLISGMGFDVNLASSCGSFGVSNLRPIHIACELGNAAMLKLLLDKGANPEVFVDVVKSELVQPKTCGSQTDQQYTYFSYYDTLVTLDAWTPLHLAVMYDNLECTKILLKLAKVWVDPVSILTKQTPLMLACKLGCHEEIVDLLLEHGCDLNHQDSFERNALYYSVLNGNVRLVEKLLRNGMELTSTEKKYQLTVLHAVSLSQHPTSVEILKLLLQFIHENYESVPCDYLVRKCLKDKISIRIGNQSVALSDMSSLTLMIVAFHVTNDDKVAETMLKKLKVYLELGDNRMFRQNCTVNNISNVDPVQLFLQLVGNKNHINNSAHKHAFLDILLTNIHDPNNLTSKSSSALLMATRENNLGLVKQLLQRGAHPDIGRYNGLSCLMIALDNSYHDIQLALLEHGASTVSETSPHQIICWNNGDKDLVATNLTNKVRRHNSLANEDYVQVSRSVPVHFAVKRGDMNAVKLLVAYGADVSETVDITVPKHCKRSEMECFSVSLLHLLTGICCSTELSFFKQTLDFLLDDCGMKIDSETGDAKETPLMFGVRFGRYNKCAYLIERGSNINAVNSDGQTSLHIAASQHEKSIMHLLLTSGCDFNKLDVKGCSVLHMCLSSNFRVGIDMLLYPLDYWQCLYDSRDSTCTCSHCNTRTLLSRNLIIPAEASTDTMECLELAILHGNKHDILTILNRCDKDTHGQIVNREFVYNMTDFTTMTVTPIFMLLESPCGNYNPGACAEILNVLISHGCDIDYVSQPEDNTILHLALRRNKVRLAKLLLDAGANTEWKFKIRDGTNVSPIHVAAILGQNEIIKYLIDRGTSSINSTMTLRRVDRVSPLHLAALYNANSAIALLTSLPGCGASVQINSSRSDTFNALFTLISKQNLIGLQNLLDTGAVDISVRCVVGRSKNASCLHIAAQVGNIEIVELLLDYGANPLATMITGDHSGILPIHLAIESGNYRIAKLFMDWGSSVNAAIMLNKRQQTRPSTSTPQSVPLEFGESIVIREWGDNSDAINGFSCLHYAVNNGNPDGVSMLLEAGANVNAQASDGNRTRLLPIHIAAQKGYKKIVKLLLEWGSELNATFSRTNQSNLSALYIGTSEGKENVVKQLLLCDAVVDKCENNLGAQPFHIVCQKGYSELLRYFIGFSDMNIDCTLHTGISALHLTSEKGYDDMTFWLLRCGMNPNTTGQITDYHSHKTSYNISPLNQACGFGHLAIVKLLIAFGADTEWREIFEDSSGIRPLHCAAIRGRINVLDFLTSQTQENNKLLVDLNSQDDEGRTVLHWAVIQGFVDCVALLLNRGVDRTIRDKTDSIAQDYATISSIRRLFAS